MYRVALWFFVIEKSSPRVRSGRRNDMSAHSSGAQATG
jgi:hypothetical protein